MGFSAEVVFNQIYHLFRKRGFFDNVRKCKTLELKKGALSLYHDYKCVDSTMLKKKEEKQCVYQT